MLKNLPAYIPLIFGLTTVATLLLFYWVMRNSRDAATRNKSTIILFGLVVWLAIQALLTLGNVYNSDTGSMPPKIMLFGILPTVLTLVLLFTTSGGRRCIDNLPLRHITYLNMVRIPVELVLFWLFLNQAVPQLMTFEGRNFDILTGLTAPFMAHFGLTKGGKLGRSVTLVWNVICLGLLANIVVLAFLSAPSPLQRLAFDQPNIAILNFPFSWLPTFIVPIVLFGHLTSIRQLLKVTM